MRLLWAEVKRLLRDLDLLVIYTTRALERALDALLARSDRRKERR